MSTSIRVGASAAHAATSHELGGAAEYLRGQRPSDGVSLMASIRGRRQRVIAWLFFPGRVDVTLRGFGGPLLAQSVGGHPTVLSDYDYGEPFEGDPWALRIAAELTPDERNALLIAAASALQARSRAVVDRKAHLRCGRDARPVAVRWEWPGIFVVLDRKTGRVIGRTMPGNPDEWLPVVAEGTLA